MSKWKIGTISGIPVNIHWSFWILPLFVLFSDSPSATLPFRLSIVVAVFGCVVLHEVGHAMMGRYFGIGTRDITLYPIGGVASLARMPKSPVAEGLIAIAGPAVNVAILAALLPLQWILNLADDSVAGTFLQSMIYINIALVVFNMLPVFPMDGGRVLRATLGLFVPHLKATHIAVRVGQVLAVVMGVVGIFTVATITFVAIFAYLAAEAELRVAHRQAMQSYEPQQYATWVDEPTSSASTPDEEPDAAKQGSSRGFVLLDKNGRKIASY